MPQLAIIADDLTGALDAAAPFAAIAGGVRVATGIEGLAAALAGNAAVVAVSTRSREVPASVAERRVRAAIAALPEETRIFKKIDSRLKGHIAAELEPLGDRPMLVAPAIPAFGRVERAGMLTGFGVDQPIPIEAALGRFGGTAAVPDVETAADMARALAAAPDGAVLVGARGLALALAGTMGLAEPPAFPALALPACFVVGSTDPITLAQVDGLRRAHPRLVHVEAPSGAVPARPEGALAPVTLLQAVAGPDAPADAVAARFAAGCASWLEGAASIVVTGGATAEALLDGLGITVLDVAGETQPGMPCCRVGPRTVVTKSGGFGTPDAFARMVPAAHGGMS